MDWCGANSQAKQSANMGTTDGHVGPSNAVRSCKRAPTSGDPQRATMRRARCSDDHRDPRR